MEALTNPTPSFNNVSSKLRINLKTSSRRRRQPTTISGNIKNLPPRKLSTHENKNLRKKSMSAIIFNALDDFVCSFLDPSPLRPSVDPENVLSGNILPVVDELPPTACEVVVVAAAEGGGSLPSCLDGAYIRNGPNHQFIPYNKNRPHHLFDGDGMLHVIRISKRKPTTFCSRYVDTYKHRVEREIGYPFVPSAFSSFNGGIASTFARLLLSFGRVVAGHFHPLNHGLGTANTSVALLPCGGGRGCLYALCEADLPYRVKVTEDGDVITLGRHDFYSSEPFARMTAHPKIDPVTGEAFAYGYDVVFPYLKFFRIDSVGRKQKEVPIESVKKCTVVHDFALTENYAVFPDGQIVINPTWVLAGRSPVGIDSAKIPRLGVIHKYAEDDDSEMRWIDSPGLNMLHCVNAWEEEDDVGRGGGAANIVVVASNALEVEEMIGDMDLAKLRLEKITINFEANTVARIPLSTAALDFGIINPAYAAKKNRYVYASVIRSKAIVGFVKLDLSLVEEDGRDCTVASHMYESGYTGGELSFVSKGTNNNQEDDGYLITYVHDENNGESKFLVIDATSPTLDIIVVVKLPARVPTGFHGLFVSESDLNKL